MTQIFAALICCLFCSSNVSALTLKFLSEQSFGGATKLGGLRLGGISQVQFKQDQVFAVSDDRGSYGGARFVVFDFDQAGRKLKFNRNLLVPVPKFSKILDFEAFHIFQNGQILLSSEGDLNQKPRVHPFLNFWQESKGFQSAVVLPEDFLAESIGLQTKGLQNNLAFESLAVSADEKSFWVFSESSLFQSTDSKIQILEYQIDQLSKPVRRLTYTRETHKGPNIEVFRGVSEALWVSPDTFLVLERWLRLDKKLNRLFGADLFLVKTQPDLVKQKILTLDGDFHGNWEGLNWIQKPGSPSILMIVSDNNLDSKVPTRFLFYETQN
jgi:hypothetical protein